MKLLKGSNPSDEAENLASEELLNEGVKTQHARQGLADWEMKRRKNPAGPEKSTPPTTISGVSHNYWHDLVTEHQYALSHASRLCEVANHYQSWPDGERELWLSTDQFIEFWKIHSSFHMRAEEEILLPFFARYADLNQEPINRMLRDHVLLRRDVSCMCEYLTSRRDYHHSAILYVLGERLENHIIYEEKHVFPLIERSLPTEALIEMARRLAAYNNDQESLLPLAT